ncbi:hypothetical protein DYB89_14840 [Vibrio cholerae]|nr:hypothetical protein [Vibrio cholerae]
MKKMFGIQQVVSFCLPDSIKQSGAILERIERETGVVYLVQLDGSEETLIVNESFIEQEISIKAVTRQGVIVYSNGAEIDLERVVAYALDSLELQADRLSEQNLKAAVKRLSTMVVE